MKTRSILGGLATMLLSAGLASATVAAAPEAKQYDRQRTTRIDTLHKRIRSRRLNDSPAYRKATWPATLLTDEDRATINRLPRNQRAARVADIAFLASAKPKRARKPRTTTAAAV